MHIYHSQPRWLCRRILAVGHRRSGLGVTTRGWLASVESPYRSIARPEATCDRYTSIGRTCLGPRHRLIAGHNICITRLSESAFSLYVLCSRPGGTCGREPVPLQFKCDKSTQRPTRTRVATRSVVKLPATRFRLPVSGRSF